MIPRSDYRAAEVVDLVTRLLHLLRPAFTDSQARERLELAIAQLSHADAGHEQRSLHRLFLAALKFTADTQTETALKTLDAALPNPCDWDKMLEAFCAMLKFLLALFRPHCDQPATQPPPDFRLHSVIMGRRTVNPRYLHANAYKIAKALDNLASPEITEELTDPEALTEAALDVITKTAGENAHAWQSYIMELEAAFDDARDHHILATVDQTREALRSIARALRDLQYENTNPLHAPPLPDQPKPAA